MVTITRKHVFALLATSLATVAFSVTAAPSARSAARTLNLLGTLQLVSTALPCPPEAPPDATECRARTGRGVVRGLGSVSESYLWSFRIGPPTCPAYVGKPLATTGRIVVTGKGEIHFALADGARCVDIEPVRNEPQAFTITGGTGPYAAASGSGTVERAVGGGVGMERWTGTLVVPGVEFDVTAPTLSGATSKTVRAPKGAKRVRVAYNVTASDALDGQVPVTCAPASGSRFPIGRTAVSCSATDTSGNTGAAKFLITVKRRR